MSKENTESRIVEEWIAEDQEHGINFTEIEKIMGDRLVYLERAENFSNLINQRITDLDSDEFAQQWAKVLVSAKVYREKRLNEEAARFNNDPDHEHMDRVRTTYHNFFIDALINLAKSEHKVTHQGVDWALNLGLSNNPKEGQVRFDLGNLAIALAVLGKYK